MRASEFWLVSATYPSTKLNTRLSFHGACSTRVQKEYEKKRKGQSMT